ncbi:MAG TPA: hypothetical protein VF766_04045 [Pyrinomonadaceae bacterium]|jgi:hypothetical protein
MAKKKETQSKTRRTQVKDLTKQEKELSKEEQKKVKGGAKQIIYSGDAPRQSEESYSIWPADREN